MLLYKEIKGKLLLFEIGSLPLPLKPANRGFHLLEIAIIAANNPEMLCDEYLWKRRQGGAVPILHAILRNSDAASARPNFLSDIIKIIAGS